MEGVNIVFGGINQAASDLDCKDGAMSILHNAVNESGAIRPFILPDPIFSMNEGEMLLYVHNTSNAKNYIYSSGQTIKAFKIEEGERVDYDFEITIGDGINILQVQSIGNTLVVITSEGMHYSLYADNNYQYLGTQIPDVPISFGLVGETKLYSNLGENGEKYGKFTITFDNIWAWNITKEFSEDNKQKITSQVIPKINTFIKEAATDKGKFLYPFFVRYALRMFDGSLIYHSAPILMIPSTKASPIALWERLTGGETVYNTAEMDIFGVVCTLDYSLLLSQQEYDALKKWKDIIRSIDIFISEQIYTYDQNGECTSFNDTDNFNGFFVGKNSVDGDKSSDADTELINKASTYYQKWTIKNLYSIMIGNGKYPNTTLNAPEIDEQKVTNKIKETSNFYLLKSIKIEEMTVQTRTNVEVEEDYLQNIVLKERMTDDYLTHDQIMPKYSYVYNQRLNLCNIRRKLYNGYDSASMCCYQNGFLIYSFNEGTASLTDLSDTGYFNIICDTTINENGEVENVRNKCSTTLAYNFGYYVFYPNANANRMLIRISNYFISSVDLKLEEHSGLNGSFYFNNFEDYNWQDSISPPTLTDAIVEQPNKIYTSEVGNALYFPLEGINTIGTGTVIGISSTTRALSQGQFGQFPLIVFSTEGIWAMEVSDTGTYSVKQPISRDVCTNAESITQLDGAVLFISDKGMMLVDGSDVSPISGELDGKNFDMSSVKQLQEVIDKEQLTELSGFIPVKDFFAQCKIAYDYPNARILVYMEGKEYMYIYSFTTQTWSTAKGNYIYSVNDYPNSYMQGSDNSITNISTKTDYDSNKNREVLMLTRPLKLGDDELKSVNMLIRRGNISRNNGAMVVFASHDGDTYIPIGSTTGGKLSRLQGSPYRYFRLMLVSDMTIKDSISFASLYYTTKWRNKPR